MVSANDLKRGVERTGDETGQAWGQGFTRGADGRLRNARGQFVKAGQELGGDLGRGMSEGVERHMPAFQSSMATAVNATRELRNEQRALQDLMRRGEGWDRVVAQSDRVAAALHRQREAASQAGDGFKEFEKASKNLSSGTGGLLSDVTKIGSAFRALGSVGMPIAISSIGGALVYAGGVAASAAQALWLLPAAAGAGVAAFGTLKLATLGFGDAMDSIRDPEKFAEALRELSPNAQQAALSIQDLLPALDQLKDAPQDSLFAGVGEQLNQLANQYLPSIRQTTTGIAAAFNQMFAGATDQLMTPQTQQAMQEFLQNVTQAFQQLAPAVAPLTKAFADIAAVGSSFLPDLAAAAADAAREFSAFITEARQSGELQQWLSNGLETLGQLGQGAWALAEAFMSLAPTGERVLPQIVTLLEQIEPMMPAIVAGAMLVSGTLGPWAAHIDLANKAFENLKGVVESVGNAVIPVINTIGQALSDALAPLRAGASLLGIDIPEYNPIAQLDLGPGNRDQSGRSRSGPRSPFGLPAAGIDPFTGLPLPGGSSAGSIGGSLAANTATGPSWGPQGTLFSNPGADTTGGRGSATSNLPTVPYGGDPMSLLQGFEPTAALYGAAGSVLDARQRSAQAESDLNTLLADNTATAQQIQDARNKVATSEREQHEADLRLQEAKQSAIDKYTNQTEKAASALGEFGAQLDQDFGVSKGLAGIADNITKFLLNLALTPIMAQLKGVQAADATYDPATAGKGLMGVMGAQGAFGPQFVPGVRGSSSGGGGAYSGGATYGGVAAPGGGGGGAYPGDAALLSNVRPGGYSQGPGRDLLKGLSDCSSSIGDLVLLLDTGSTEGPNLSTHNAASWLPQHGFLPGKGGPGDFRVGYNSGHMQATLPGGTPWNWGSDAAAARGGVGGTGAFDPSFTDHYYRPAGGGGAPAGGGAPWAPSGSAAGGGGGAPAAAGGGGGGWAGPGIPAGLSGGGGRSPIFGGVPQGPGVGGGLGGPGIPGLGGGPGVGGGLGFGGAAPSQSVTGGRSYGQGIPASGGIGFGGGLIGAAGGAASMGMNLMAPGSGAGAQIGMDLMMRAVGAGGQYAANAVGGLLETFALNDSALGDPGKSWFGRLAIGVAGMRPALPNTAGEQGGKQNEAMAEGGKKPAPALTPQQAEAAKASAGKGADAVNAKGGDTNINVTNNRATEDGTGRDIQAHLGAQRSAGGGLGSGGGGWGGKP